MIDQEGGDDYTAKIRLARGWVYISEHALDRFVERYDTTIPNRITALTLIQRRMQAMTQHGSDEVNKIFWCDERWRFVIKKLPRRYMLVTCIRRSNG